MSHWHGNLKKKKLSGGRKRAYRGKRRYEGGGFPVETVMGDHKTKIDRVRGGNLKIRLINTKWVNVSNPSTGTTEKAEILQVIENPANVDYDRRSVLTKGTYLETSLGKAKITSRPGQSGILNAVLI